MSLPAFEVARPKRLDAAVDALGRYGADAQIVAGGTDLIPSMKQSLFAPRILLDIKRIRELDYIHFEPEQGLAIDRKSTRLNSSHIQKSRMPSSA